MSENKRPAHPKTQTVRVMFVCIGNSCRSPMAEAIAIRDAGDLMDCCSAGLSPLGKVQNQTQETLRQNGYPTEALRSKAIGSTEWAAADLIINMSGYRKERTFPHTDWHKIEDWDVDDPYGEDAEFYQRTFEDLQARIELLKERLGKRLAMP